MYQPGDKVQVLNSKRGYQGPGEIVDVAYAGRYLVKVNISGRDTVITAKFQELKKIPTDTVVQKKKK